MKEMKEIVVIKLGGSTLSEMDNNLKEADLLYICSLSSKTIVYKGMLTCSQLAKFYLDLQDKSFKCKRTSKRQRGRNYS